MFSQLQMKATVAVFGLALGSSALGQQFQDQTLAPNNRFPALLEYTSQCTFGDIDGDNDLDIIFANGNGFGCPVTPQVLRVYINDGLGFFADESVVRTGGAAFRARGVELGDIERDGDLDVIVAQDCVQPAQLLVNNGLGFFTNETVARMPVPVVNMSSSRGQFGDLDNDGDLDLFFCNGGTSRFGTGPNKVFLNNGSGVFTDYSATAMAGIASVTEPMDAILGDIDGDLDLDANVGARGGASRLYSNNGSGVFTQLAFPAEGATYSYDFGDINGDGDFDLLGANSGANNAEQLLGNNGTGAFAVLAFPALNADDNDSKFFDYDNDGDLDLIVCRISGSDRIYTNSNGTGTFVLGAGLITANVDSSLDVKVGDLTGDGKIDIVTANGESSNFQDRIYVNTGGAAVIDNRAPRIIDTDDLPDTTELGPFVVRTVIYDDYTSDRGFHDKGVFLNYTVDGGAVQQVEMDWSGNSLWRGVLPAQKAPGTIEYWVTATDWNNNLGTENPTHVFVIEPEVLPCPGDLDGDATVNVIDLLDLIEVWGACADPGNCPADIAPPGGNDTVDINDLLALIGLWGPCP